MIINKMSLIYLSKTLINNILRYISSAYIHSMIPTAEVLKIISVFLYICDLYDSELKYLCQRFSNNIEHKFRIHKTDIYKAFKLSSSKGLMGYIFGRITAAYF